jgi:hypothetical protein
MRFFTEVRVKGTILCVIIYSRRGICINSEWKNHQFIVWPNGSLTIVYSALTTPCLQGPHSLGTLNLNQLAEARLLQQPGMEEGAPCLPLLSAWGSPPLDLEQLWCTLSTCSPWEPQCQSHFLNLMFNMTTIKTIKENFFFFFFFEARYYVAQADLELTILPSPGTTDAPPYPVWKTLNYISHKRHVRSGFTTTAILSGILRAHSLYMWPLQCGSPCRDSALLGWCFSQMVSEH